MHATSWVLLRLSTMYGRTMVQDIGPLLVGLEYISRRFINNLVLDLIVVCIDAPGDWLQSTLKIGSQTAFLTVVNIT